ncbi:Hypothetical predicted protein [Pelobates cultripes]|uniref:Uncharacterized protein n=1 Tax=Pelobates cultripes TaxID=61616 RepID=A0AAD1SJ45_PELCU|nr:Hypothetical predicted protein [Pelobates cultripes]
MNPVILGIFCLLACAQSRAIQNEQSNALDLSENRELFLNALQAYFRRRGIQIDRKAPSFIILSSKLQSNHDSYPYGEGFRQTGIRAHSSKKDIGWENFF